MKVNVWLGYSRDLIRQWRRRLPRSAKKVRVTSLGYLWWKHETVFQFGRPWRGFWMQLRWCPRRWNFGAGVVAGLNETSPPSWAHDVGFYVRVGPLWLDVGHGSQSSR